MSDYTFAASVLESEAKSYRHEVFRGREIHGDPEEELAVYERMADKCEEAAAVLKVLSIVYPK